MRLPAKNITAVGVDGCPGGWIAVIKKTNEPLAYRFASEFAEILGELPESSFILVDMILGLPDTHHRFRACDVEARQKLKPYGSRVFSAPPREALQAGTYSEACERSRNAIGKAISRQTYHLLPRIRQLDALSDPRIRESHPELVFSKLAGTPVGPSKKTAEGRTSRLRLLNTVLPESSNLYQKVVEQLPRSSVGFDDIIDALALCSAAQMPSSLHVLPAKDIPRDGTGKAMQICY